MKSIAVLLCILAGPAVGAPAPADEIAHELQLPAALAEVSGGERLLLRNQVVSAYQGRGDQPIWTDDQRPLPAAWKMLGAIHSADDDALRPEDYHLRALDGLFASLRVADPPEDARERQLAAPDILLSDAFLLYSQHEQNGRVNLSDQDPSLTHHMHGDDPRDNLRLVAEGADPADMLRSIAPSTAYYAGLRAALLNYRVIAASGGFPVVPAGMPPQLKAGDPRVQVLIERLRAEGDLAQATGITDADLTAALQHFQTRNGLAPTGVIDAATLAALNVPVQARIDEIRVNMERLRWLPHRPAPTRLVVNIANFRAALYQNGKLRMSEPVVVGTPFRQTPEFRDHIQYLVVNPVWDVPSLITTQDLLPRLQADPGYLSAHGYQVVEGWGDAAHPVASDAIDWKRWTPDDLPYHLRQLPGPENALGRVKFMFPNRFGIYLHDTPAQGLFAEDNRAFSSGCIRVADALDLAEAILRVDGQAGAHQLLQDALAAGTPQQIALQHPISIYIVYFTAWADRDGTVEFRNDIYDRDVEILHALDAASPRYSRRR
ncbi:MAG TPA: L,D-transpeptidase family protein [Gammaproteobacteria bacterium]|nr:L,D-transpeptidase family protein [Gammaproteobacteria bacterium]